MKNKLTFKKLIIIILAAIFIFSYIRQGITMNRIKKEIADKQIQLDDAKQKNERLQDEVEKINSDSSDYLERLARERLGMIKPGEKVVNNGTEEENSN